MSTNFVHWYILYSNKFTFLWVIMTNYLNKRLLMTMLLLYIVCCIGYHKKWGCHFIVFSYLIFFLSLIICKWFPRNLLLWYVITISKKARLLGIKRNKMYFVTYCYFFFVCCCLSLFLLIFCDIAFAINVFLWCRKIFFIFLYERNINCLYRNNQHLKRDKS